MIFISRLFGFMVILVLFGAIFLNLANNINVDSVVNLASLNLDDKQQSSAVPEDEVFFDEFLNDELPLEFRSGSSVSDLVKVEINNRNDLKGVIFKENKVVVMLNNEYLNNPYIPFENTFLTTLTGYNQTHFFSDGTEVGGNNFIYLADDLMNAFTRSGLQAWIIN
jgi:hypothetical protein